MEDFEPEQNLQAWEEDTYQAWTARFGSPAEAAVRIKRNPRLVMSPILEFFGPTSGKRIVNLMGSNGVKAVALTCLGADVTVIDWSPSNARYARELAAEAGLSLSYVISDITKAPQRQAGPRFDVAFAELGIVHYFTDLKPLMDTVFDMIAKGGRFVLRDFHPVSTKLITYRGSTAKVRKHKVTGDYFDTSLEERDVPFTKHLVADVLERKSPKLLWRKWTLGEVVTAVADSGLHIQILREEPNFSSDVYDKGIPKTYTLVADKLQIE